jgi:adenosylcobyric acid synthase
MGLARAANLPVVVVGDIDRGGLLAHVFGTVAVLEPEDQHLICGFLVNKFRGDPALLTPGLNQLEQLTGRPTYGVIPYTDDLWLDAEDSVSVVTHRVVGEPQPPRGQQWLRVAAIRLPRISNSTDVEALACEPGVLVRWVSDVADLADADIVVIPGSKATVADLAWLRDRGLADGIAAHVRLGKPVLGICGGFQMLCRRIEDTVESGAGSVDGLGLLDADIEFAADKTLRHHDGHHDAPLHGYEIHHGQVGRSAADDWLGVGIRSGSVFGTHWHGLFDNDAVRRQWLSDAAAASGRAGFVVADDVDVQARRDAQLDLMADLLTSHVDLDALLALLDGEPPQRPTIITGLTP